ncbi:hypothetical protein AEYBE204_09260 [Asticcacaulis sp. YBE204]|nr:hypothetical protein AEYBE204_09260 [Asticcacaulis sp. YBE204]
MQCIWEAKWPLRHSSAYKSADVRTKRQLANSSNPELRKMQGVCRALSSTSDTEKRQARSTCQELLLVKRMRGGDDARLHANRIERVCTALADPPETLMKEGNLR